MPTLYGQSGTAYRVDDEPFNTSGGQSELFRCRDSGNRVWVYKRYRSPITEAEPIDWLRAVTSKGRTAITDAEGAAGLAETAESSINWPIDLIVDNDAAVGVVLPFIPSSFLRTDGKPRTFDYLCLASADPPSAAIRVGVLIRVCDIFAVLEQDGLIYGDISQKNIVWRSLRTHAYLIDCDSMRPFDSTAQRGVGTEGWKDPRWIAGRIPAHDQYSDRFGLAVAMYRGLFLNPGAPTLVAGQWHKPSGLPADLDGRLRALFARAFDEPFRTEERPTAAEWRAALIAVFLTSDGDGFRQAPLKVLTRHADQFRPAPVARQPVTVRRQPVTVGPRVAPTPRIAPATARPRSSGQTRSNTGGKVAGIAFILIVLAAALLAGLDVKDEPVRGGWPSTVIVAGPNDPLPSQLPFSVGDMLTGRTPYPAVPVGSCLEAIAGRVGASGSCDSPNLPYIVVEGRRGTRSCSTGSFTAVAAANDGRMCVKPNLVPHNCYSYPPYGWITSVACDRPAGGRIVLVLPDGSPCTDPFGTPLVDISGGPPKTLCTASLR